jgi:Domain of unknown function (DUF6438)
MTSEQPDLYRGKRVASELRRLRRDGILVTAAEQGLITELACQMPECLCPEELGGRHRFDPLPVPMSDWVPTPDHYRVLKKDGGHLTLDNVRLAHRLCNSVDYAKSIGRSTEKDRARVEAGRRAAIAHADSSESAFVGLGDGERMASIEVRRGMCFGPCPAYEVVLHQDGSATWRGEAYVDRIGDHAGQFDVSDFERLAALVERVGFFSWQDEYTQPVTDLPTYVLAVTTTERSKSVVQYATDDPPNFWVLASLVDHIAGHATWRPGGPQDGLRRAGEEAAQDAWESDL